MRYFPAAVTATLTLLIGCASTNSGPANGSPPTSADTTYTWTNENGEIFPLDAPYENIEDPAAAPPDTAGLTVVRQALSGRPAEAQQSLDALQSGFRSQGSRGTCVVHAVAAAMEAALARQGHPGVDLSEQWMQHITKMTKLIRFGSTEPTNTWTRDGYENSLGMWGGHNIVSAASLFSTGYRVPEEHLMPYQDAPGYQDTDDPGDDPFANWRDRTGRILQRTVNDYNLSQNPTTILTPGSFTLTPFPQPALEGARYGIQGFVEANGTELRDPAWYESQLGAGREVVIGLAWAVGPPDADGVRHPEGQREGGHAVLVVGYDRSDPSNPFLIVKNSWGRGVFWRLSYDFIEGDEPGKITQALYLTGIDVLNAVPPEDLALGRWQLTWDGQTGTLDINRKPGYYSKARLGVEDRRWGTYFDAAEQVFRVNGSIGSGGEIVFHIDPDNPDAYYDEVGGTKFTGRINPATPDLMTGTFSSPSGRSSAFTARKPLGLRLAIAADPTVFRPGQSVRLDADPSAFTDAAAVVTKWFVEEGSGGPRSLVGTTTGTGSLSANLPCRSDLLVHAEAQHPQTGEASDRMLAVSCLSQQATTFLHADADHSGMVGNDGTVRPLRGLQEFHVGDTPADADRHSLLDFDLSVLSAAAGVDAATLTLWAGRTEGTPSDLLGLRAMQVNYGPTLDASDHRAAGSIQFLPGMIRLPNAPSGALTLDVTNLVKDALQEGRDRLQIAVFYSQATDGDGKADATVFTAVRPGTLLMPTLELNYQNF